MKEIINGVSNEFVELTVESFVEHYYSWWSTAMQEEMVEHIRLAAVKIELVEYANELRVADTHTIN